MKLQFIVALIAFLFIISGCAKEVINVPSAFEEGTITLRFVDQATGFPVSTENKTQTEEVGVLTYYCDSDSCGKQYSFSRRFAPVVSFQDRIGTYNVSAFFLGWGYCQQKFIFNITRIPVEQKVFVIKSGELGCRGEQLPDSFTMNLSIDTSSPAFGGHYEALVVFRNRIVISGSMNEHNDKKCMVDATTRSWVELNSAARCSGPTLDYGELQQQINTKRIIPNDHSPPMDQWRYEILNTT